MTLHCPGTDVTSRSDNPIIERKNWSRWPSCLLRCYWLQSFSEKGRFPSDESGLRHRLHLTLHRQKEVGVSRSCTPIQDSPQERSSDQGVSRREKRAISRRNPLSTGGGTYVIATSFVDRDWSVSRFGHGTKHGIPRFRALSQIRHLVNCTPEAKRTSHPLPNPRFMKVNIQTETRYDFYFY
ncbi:hypothetical protein AVEN_156037-1 [Araneus ventricosus]|uniref:Uncharacterized protein n=1 Tax=Araneus ventricosus TaxID=182803 RepID=A0A4Y2SQB1_ARAVE|nr:hypothetical protein AVEN_156037-1 [Araneus ventricosus]